MLLGSGNTFLFKINTAKQITIEVIHIVIFTALSLDADGVSNILIYFKCAFEFGEDSCFKK